MEVFSAESLNNMVKRCEDDLYEYNGCIMVDRTTNLVHLMSSLRENEIEKNVDSVERVTHDIMRGTGKILFKNGNGIDIITASNMDRIRGRYYDEYICFGDISSEVLGVLGRHELAVRARKQAKSADLININNEWAEESDELDQFLDSFKINKD